MVVPEVDLSRGIFFRIAGTSEAETSVSGKAKCLFAIGEDKKVSFQECSPLNFHYLNKLGICLN